MDAHPESTGQLQVIIAMPHKKRNAFEAFMHGIESGCAPSTLCLSLCLRLRLRLRKMLFVKALREKLGHLGLAEDRCAPVHREDLGP